MVFSLWQHPLAWRPRAVSLLFFLPKVLLTRPFFFSAMTSPHASYFEDSCYSSLGARLVQDNHPISRPWTELSLVEHTWAEREDSQFRDAPLRFSLKISEQQRSRKKRTSKGNSKAKPLFQKRYIRGRNYIMNDLQGHFSLAGI